MGRYVRTLKPGLHLVIPFISRVYRVDTRVQTLDISRTEVMTKDLSPTIVEAFLQYRMVEPEKSLLRVEKHKNSLSHVAQSHIRTLTMDMTLEGLLGSQKEINSRFKQLMEMEAKNLGMEIVRAELKDVEPVGPVKAAIEDRIAAEKERQAMILRADGRRRALLMENEGREGQNR